jgi:cytoskeleton protein RodZ
MPNDSLPNETIDQGYPPSASGATQVGAGLRAVRERLGWQLADVAEALRIRLPYLEAIERGDLTALPGPAYQTGFVRSYAQLLGLDPEEILRRFQAEGLGRAPKAQLSFPAPVPDRGVPSGAIALVGVVAVLVGYGLWYHYTAHERHLALTVPNVPAELAPLAVPPKPPTPVQPKPAAAPAPVATTAPTTPALTSTIPTTASAPATSSTPAAATTTPMTTPVTGSTPSAAPGPMPPTSAASASTQAASQAPATQGVVAAPAPDSAVQGEAILATSDSWVQVRDATGTILFSKVLRAGQSWPVPQEAGLTMTTGNAGGTEITKDGKPGAPLGATGVVLHRYNLTPPAASGAANANN